MMEKSNPCDGCSKCCEYVCLEIDKPENKNDFDEIRWFLLHKDVWVFIDNDDSWNLQFNTPCEKLKENGWCGYYEKRPSICKKHEHESCEKYGEGDSFKVIWKDVEEFNLWIKDGKVIPED